MQKITIWFLPIIVIAGLFYPFLGYLVVAMMAFFVTLSFFKGRYWCWNLCPRGAFLDIALSKISRKRPVPKVFLKQYFRWLVFISLMGLLIFRMIRANGDPVLIGSIFVGTCLSTTVIAILLGILTKHRAWCMICPMGTLQENIGRIRKQNGQKRL